MTMNLTDEQQMLRDSVSRFLAKQYDFARREKLAIDADGSDRIWREFAELGWIGACLTEAQGGYGGPEETAILMQEFGRYLVLEPLLESAIIGGQLLSALPVEKAESLIEALIGGELHIALATTERHSRHDLSHVETIARPDGNCWVLDGVKTLVANGERAGLIFVTARTDKGVSLFMVDADALGISRTPLRTHDGRGAAQIAFTDCKVAADGLVGEEGQGLKIVERVQDHANAALCAEAVGSADHVLAATIEYLKTRVQYDAPLAKLQVLQHRIAEMFVATEQARVMAAFATKALALPDEERETRVSAARVAMDDYTGFVRKQAVQLHGGMGVSEELDIAHHLKRWMVASLSHGDTAHHLSRYMRHEA